MENEEEHIEKIRSRTKHVCDNVFVASAIGPHGLEIANGTLSLCMWWITEKWRLYGIKSSLFQKTDGNLTHRCFVVKAMLG